MKTAIRDHVMVCVEKNYLISLTVYFFTGMSASLQHVAVLIDVTLTCDNNRKIFMDYADFLKDFDITPYDCMDFMKERGASKQMKWHLLSFLLIKFFFISKFILI